MHDGRTVFSQLTDVLPKHEFDRCVERYDGSRSVTASNRQGERSPEKKCQKRN